MQHTQAVYVHKIHRWSWGGYDYAMAHDITEIGLEPVARKLKAEGYETSITSDQYAGRKYYTLKGERVHDGK